MKILIFGLPGSGKTTLAVFLMELLGPDTVWYNADAIRKQYDDWDFSDEGRLRQANRMKDLMEEADQDGFDVICDFVCPTNELRELFDEDTYRVYVDTIDEGRFDDTNKLFEDPPLQDKALASPNYVVLEQRGDEDARHIMWELRGKEFSGKKPTAQMLGRFQPWHEGHQALFERALSKTGQVLLMIRDMSTDESNPYSATEVAENLRLELAQYAGKVLTAIVPNITHIVYGRGVGYKVEQESFDEETESVSATKIREKLRKDGVLGSL